MNSQNIKINQTKKIKNKNNEINLYIYIYIYPTQFETQNNISIHQPTKNQLKMSS